ncbi:hypothetical protein N5U19_08495 [Aliarcobacter butzleri]|uniref:hypothetical protein n=1 Tax=Aliarcobacter butzleri TaxID=28197 RepID=UPI0021B6C184|nr:hypothetical protein [Aliarcobacter butzleri]MCT7650922.1 hypothetical protein [Aliarcobacter butzleri]
MYNDIKKLSPEAFRKLCDYLGANCNYKDVDCVIDAINEKKRKEIDEEIKRRNILLEIDKKNILLEIDKKIMQNISEIVNSHLKQEQEQLESDLYNDNSLHR